MSKIQIYRHNYVNREERLLEMMVEGGGGERGQDKTKFKKNKIKFGGQLDSNI